jgi:hypothetical protein
MKKIKDKPYIGSVSVDTREIWDSFEKYAKTQGRSRSAQVRYFFDEAIKNLIISKKI